MAVTSGRRPHEAHLLEPGQRREGPDEHGQLGTGTAEEARPVPTEVQLGGVTSVADGPPARLRRAVREVDAGHVEPCADHFGQHFDGIRGRA